MAQAANLGLIRPPLVYLQDRLSDKWKSSAYRRTKRLQPDGWLRHPPLRRPSVMRSSLEVVLGEHMGNMQLAMALCCALLLGSNLQAQTTNDQSVANPALRLELLDRVKQDQAIRTEFIKKGVEHPDPSVLARMQAIDNANAERMSAIVRQYGWPGPELVGQDGTEAAFLLVQHADLPLQKEMLPLVEKAYKKGELSGQSYALLLDRVLVREGKPQVYGTQAKRLAEWKGKEPVLEPIEDEGNVDKRRAEVGLMPLSEYRELLKQMYFPREKGKP